MAALPNSGGRSFHRQERGDAADEHISYAWEQVSGPAVRLGEAKTLHPTFEAPAGQLHDRDIVFQVTVADGVHNVSDTVRITVAGNPDNILVDAGADLVASGNERVSLGVSTQTAVACIRLDAAAVATYGGADQDINAKVSIEDDGTTIRLTGNGWKKVGLPQTVTEDTILEFDFQSKSEGEIHGIGFDNDDGLNADRTFKIYGTQDWGINDHDNYATAPGEWQHYRIRVGDHFTGDFNYLTFAMDQDVSVPDGESVFSNIRIYEEEQVDTSGAGLTYAWRQVSGTPVKLINGDTANPTFTAPSLETSEDTVFEVSVSNGKTTATDSVTVRISANEPSTTVSDSVRTPAVPVVSTGTESAASAIPVRTARLDLDDLERLESADRAMTSRAAAATHVAASLGSAGDPPVSSGATAELDAVRERIGGAPGQVDSPQGELGELDDRADSTAGRLADSELTEPTVDSGELPGEQPHQEEAPSRLSTLASRSFGWVWGMFRAYGGVREETQPAEGRSNQTRT